MKKAFVYMLRCSDGSLYTGWTNNLKNRLEKHNKGLGAKYTRARRPCNMVFFIEVSDKKRAMQIEYRIKRLNKKYKENIVSNFDRKKLELITR
ncbi:GIY-YIG nuclease family protein [Anaerococcus rubeinfantis]|uniref:GIY-YIG nuclease family protein n=1 Tax=Anaerococcus rubeinfantis TaxID=1720199 RepID=UPI00073ECCDB|nr:GIY-YIG nuclease family protein [Anaerococcus rubeinfantis]